MNGSGTSKRSTPSRPVPTATPTKRTRTVAGIVLGIFGQLLLLAVMIIFLIGCIGGGLIGGGVYGIIKSTPAINPETLKVRNFNSYIYDLEGNTIAELKQGENRVWIDYPEIPKQLILAYVALEDKRFFEHDGVDYKRIGSALVSYLKHFIDPKVDIQGGSTIDQQLIKNLTGNQETTIKRKVQEQWQAIQLEKGLTKEEIMTLYLNTIPMGGNFYGIETAAKGYFGKDVRTLSLAECASLSGITNWPNKYMPISPANIKANIERAHLCLSLMLEQGKITQLEYDAAKAENIRFNYNPEAGKVTVTSKQSYFVDEAISRVKRDLMTTYGYSDLTALTVIYNNGLKIQTTMDPKIQKILDGVFNDPNNFSGKNPLTVEPAQGAMVVMDPKTGAVRGIYGGQGEKLGSVFNRSTQAERSPGSSIKPLVVYAPGIDSKKLTAATVVDDVPQYLNDKTIGKQWPKNVENANFGLTGVRQGLYRSRNVVATLNLIFNTGIQTGLEYLAKVGIDRRQEQYASIAMGGFTRGMTPLQMAAAYTVFANQGVFSEPMFYTQVLDYSGKLILNNVPVHREVYAPETIYIMDSILGDVITKGTAYPYGIVKYKATATDRNGKEKEVTVTIPSGGKTGTTDENKDKWFCGFTPYYVGVAWYGYDTAVKLTTGERNSALNIWNLVMTQIHEGLPSKPFFEKAPDNVIRVDVCMDSGLRPNEYCAADPRGSRVHSEMFIRGTEPKATEICAVHYLARVTTLEIDAQGRPLLANEFCPPDTVAEIVRIRRPVEYKPLFPEDKYPLDVKYEAAEGEYCTLHGPGSALPASSVTDGAIILDPGMIVPEVSPSPAASPVAAPAATPVPAP